MLLNTQTRTKEMRPFQYTTKVIYNNLKRGSKNNRVLNIMSNILQESVRTSCGSNKSMLFCETPSQNFTIEAVLSRSKRVG